MPRNSTLPDSCSREDGAGGVVQAVEPVPSPPRDSLLLGHGECAGFRRWSLRRGLLGHCGVSSRWSTWRAGGRRQQLWQSGAGEPAGRAASGGGHPRGPGPASRGKSRLRVTNSFPGSRAGAAARAASQPAQHPGRLPRLSSPTSFAPSSGDEPSWSLQALRVKPRGTGCLSRPAWLSCSPHSRCPSCRLGIRVPGAHAAPQCSRHPHEERRP